MDRLKVYNCKDLPSTTLVETEDKGSQSETDQTQRTRVGNFEERRVVDLRHHGLVRLLDISVSLLIVMMRMVAVILVAIFLVGILCRSCCPVGGRSA
jgi:hypothetical protein